jgi:hypothetical protein
MSHEYSTEYVLPNGDMTFSLSEYVQANVDAERQRIIKLLEGKIIVKNVLYNELPEQDKYMNLMLGHVIALIKGEK